MPSALGSSLPLSLAELNNLKHAVIGNPVRKAAVLADDALVQRIVAHCRAEANEGSDGRARRIEAVIVVGSLSHAGKQAMPTLLTLPGVLPNLLSSLRAALPAAGPSPAQSTTSQVDLKGLTAVLQSLANAVGAMHHFVSGGRWGSGLTEDDPTGGHNAESAEIRVEWRGAIARQVHGFLQDDAATDLLALLPASPAPDGPTEDGAGHAPSYDLPARALVPLLRLLHDLASFAPSTKEALLAAPEPSRSLKGKERAAHKSSVMEVDEPNSRWQDPWAFGRIKAILDASLVPVKGAKGDQAKVLRAALKLVAVLKPEHLSTETAIGDLAQACLAHPDEGVRFGAAYAFSSMPSTKSTSGGMPPSAEDFAKFFTALLGLWADITLPATVLTLTAAASAKPAEPPEVSSITALTEDQIRAVFLLAHAVQGNVEAHALMVEVGVLRRLGELLSLGSGDNVEWRETHELRADAGPDSKADAFNELELGEEDREGHARLREGLLLTFAAVALSSTQHHTAILLIPALIRSTLASLGHPTAAVRAAACQLVRGLSRNVGVLRETLVDSGVGQRLVAVLQGSYDVDGQERDAVLAGALASAANLLLELSPMKETLVQADILPCIFRYAQKPFPADVRLNALWSLKNFAYRASPRHRLILLESLPTLSLADVDWTCDTGSEEVKEVANLLSNIFIGADPTVKWKAQYILDSELVDSFLASTTAAKPATDASRVAFTEVCTLLRILHAAQLPQAGEPTDPMRAHRLLRFAARAFEHGVPGTQLQLARLIGTLIEELWQADALQNSRLGADSDTRALLKTICARRPADDGGADHSTADLVEALAWIAARVAASDVGSGRS